MKPQLLAGASLIGLLMWWGVIKFAMWMYWGHR